jgi:hypothetical protein
MGTGVEVAVASPSVGAGGRAYRAVHSRSVNPAELLVSGVIAMLIIGLCLMLAFFNPAGRIRSSPVLADRAIGGVCDAPEGWV